MSGTVFIHESAIVDDEAIIGSGTKIWHFCHVMSGAKIGKNCILGQNVYVGGLAEIGDGCKIQNNVSVYDMVSLADNVFVGPSVVFTNVLRPRAEVRRSMDEYLPTRVEQGATIGANTTVICGHTIGRYSFVGAGSVVTGDIPDYALVHGDTFKIAGWVCECGEKLGFGMTVASLLPGGGMSSECSRCGKLYEKRESVVKRVVMEE